VLLSTSGTSPNVVRAAERGREIGMHVWAMTGRGPNPLQERSDDALCVDAPSTAAIQAVHLVAIHALCAVLDAELANLTAGAALGAGPARGAHADLNAEPALGADPTLGAHALTAAPHASPVRATPDPLRRSA